MFGGSGEQQQETWSCKLLHHDNFMGQLNTTIIDCIYARPSFVTLVIFESLA